tara:strand:+ start:19821 stop:20585 length:765 start_codon:yes stop_codon:yes gene_type:complete
LKYSLGGKQFIEFKTDVNGLEEIAPVKPAKYFLPKWFKGMKDFVEVDAVHEKNKPNYFGKKGDTAKKHTSGTVKRCPAIVDLITEGFIIPMWSDFLIQRDMETFEWDNKNFQYGIEFHSKEQIKGWNLKKTDFPEGIKFVNPWRIYTPKGYSVMFMTPTYQFEKRFTVLPGIVETDSYHHINFPSIWHTTKDAVIERGTPFIQVIPFKRDKWNLDVSQMNTEDLKNDETEKTALSTKFKNAYRDIVSRNKNINS